MAKPRRQAAIAVDNVITLRLLQQNLSPGSNVSTQSSSIPLSTPPSVEKTCSSLQQAPGVCRSFVAERGTPAWVVFTFRIGRGPPGRSQTAIFKSVSFEETERRTPAFIVCDKLHPERQRFTNERLFVPVLHFK